MRWTRQLAVPTCTGIILLALAAPVSAQSTVEAFGSYELGLDSPGAKSLGMAGAILATIDDASAAVINPAGLTALDEQDVTIEFRQRQPIYSFTQTGTANPPNGAVSATVGRGRQQRELTRVSFLSYTRPFSKGAISLYYHDLVLASPEHRSFSPKATVGRGDKQVRVEASPSRGFLDLSVDSFGVSAAFKAGENFSIGIGVAQQMLDLNATTSRFQFDTAPLFAPDPWAPSLQEEEQTARGDDEDIVFNVGIKYDDERWSFGASYRQGGEFDYQVSNLAGALLRGTPEEQGKIRSSTRPDFQPGSSTGTLQIPDMYGFGIAFKPARSFTISLEWDHISYGDLDNDIASPFDTGPGCSGPCDGILGLGDFVVDDADTLHLGFEWKQDHPKYPVSIWWGVWEDEAHRVAWNGDLANLDKNSAFLATTFFKGEDETHYSVGSGFGLGSLVSVALAGDFSDVGDTVIGSISLGF